MTPKPFHVKTLSRIRRIIGMPIGILGDGFTLIGRGLTYIGISISYGVETANDFWMSL
jgi:hypothetical protein